MATRRILVMLAVLMGITALSVSVAPAPKQRSTPTPTPQAGGAEAPAAGGRVVERTISAEAPEAATIGVPFGALLRLTVRARALDSVIVEDLDLFAPVSPEAPGQIEWLADRAGSFDVRLVETGRLVGRIEVTQTQ